ncbi:MAG TPA: YfhO family protein, partial [Chloroflexota bacterium]|nr:YfhO family protein [Chloroflexota bacterium]
TALFYPVGLLVNLVGGRHGLPYLALEWRAAGDVLLGALFSYLFVCRLTASRVAGVVGATVFCFGGYLTSYPLPQLPVLEASIWLPLILYGLERGLTAPRPAAGTPWFGLAGLAGAALLLAGHGQTALLAAYTVAGFSLWRWLALRRRPLVALGQFALAAAVAVGLSAPQWLPTLDYLPVTNRVALPYAAAAGGFHWTDYQQLLFPGDYFERSYYGGVLALLLALVGLRRRAAWGWLALGVIASLLALGGNGPLFPLLYGHLPGFASFEDQERAAYLVAFAGAVLAGLGTVETLAWLGSASAPLRSPSFPSSSSDRELAEQAQSAPGERARLGAALISVLALGSTLAGAALLRQYAPPPNDPALTAPLTVNILAALLLAAGALLVLMAIRRQWLPARTAAVLLCLLPAINLLGANGALGRTTINPLPALPVKAATFLYQQPGVWRVDTLRDGELPRNVGAQLALSFPRGDDPLVIVRSATLAGQANRYKVWQLFNVQYLLARQNPGAGFQQVARLDGFNVFRMLYPLPRAWAVRDLHTAATPGQALTATLALQQPGAAAVLEASPGLSVQGPALPSNQQERWLQASPEYLHLHVTLTDNALLVISQPFAPGWTASVDGRPARLLRADYAFDGLALTAGSHDVVLRYLPAGLLAGLAAAVAALLLLAGSLLLCTFLAKHARRS